jgi:hypothetical protein
MLSFFFFLDLHFSTHVGRLNVIIFLISLSPLAHVCLGLNEREIIHNNFFFCSALVISGIFGVELMKGNLLHVVSYQAKLIINQT